MEVGRWFPRWFSGKGSTCQCRRHRFKSWVRRMPWRRKWLSTSVFLLVKLHEQRSLVGYSPWGLKQVDSTGYTHTHTHTHITIYVFMSCLSSLCCPEIIVTFFSLCCLFWKLSNYHDHHGKIVQGL